MHSNKLMSLLRIAAVGGNIVFILWIFFNAMDEGLKGNLIEKLSAIGLTGLLVVNSALLLNKLGRERGIFFDHKL